MSAVTGADGTYVIKLLAGNYAIKIMPVPDAYEDPGLQNVTVPPGSLVTVNFKLKRKATIGGVVTDDLDSPVAGVTVTASSV